VTTAPIPVGAERSAAWQRALCRLAPTFPLVATLALIAVFLLVATPGFIVTDTWLALMAGREVAQHGIPFHEHLTVLAAGRRWVDQQWLGQLLLYGIALVGGVKAVVLVGAAAALSAWGLAIAASGRRGAPSPGVVTLLVVAGVLSCPWALQVRTQEIVLPVYAGILWLLLADPLLTRRRTLLVIPLLVLWANVHGSVLLGAGVVAAYAATACRATPRRRLVPYLLVPLTIFVSPYGFHLAGYYRLMLFTAPFRNAIPEWQPARPSLLTGIFYALAAATALTVIRNRRSYHLGELAVLAITFASATLAIRNIVWFAIAAAAILPVRRVGVGEPFRTSGAGAAALAAALVIPATAAVALAKPNTYWQGRVSAASTGAVASVIRTPGPVFADDSHADWLLWNFPALRGRIVYDDRVELLTKAQLDGVERTLYSSRGSRFGACVFVVDPGRTTQLPGRVVWRDSTTAVIQRRSPHCRRPA
jgi:hypothetical protein